jgi:small subunit ribosomal protein S20
MTLQISNDQVQLRPARQENIFGEMSLANIKSAIKRNKQNEKRRLRNRVHRGRARSFVKEAREQIASENMDEARAATLKAISALDKAAEKGVLHKNNAARRKSRLMKRLAGLEKTAE